MAGYDDQMPFGVVPSYDPMTGALIGSDPGRTEPEAMPNRVARGIIQAIANMPKAAAIDAPAALIDSARMAPLPGAERTPEGDAAMQDLAGNSFMTALGLAGGGMPFSTAGAAGIFGGRLAKTADHAMLQKAEEMHAAGADRRAIWDQTGWFRGEDGKWRFEIPDDKARMNPNTYGEKMPTMRDGRIAGQIWHPELYEAYPDLRNAYGVVEGTQNKVGGSYSPPGVARSGDETINIQAPNAGAARSVGLHELQHAIQEREGFASGGNPAMFSQGDDALIARRALAMRLQMAKMPKGMSAAEKADAVAKKYGELSADNPTTKAALEVALNEADNPSPTLQKVVDLYGLNDRTTPISPRDLYREVPGEVEARNVQMRADVPRDWLRARPPWETADMQSRPAVSRMFGSRVGLLEGGQASKAAQMSVPETIRGAAIRHRGEIFEGPLHSDAYEAAASKTGLAFGDIIGATNPRDSGFVTSTGRFVSREEAERIARAARQIGDIGNTELAAEHFGIGGIR